MIAFNFFLAKTYVCCRGRNFYLVRAVILMGLSENRPPTPQASILPTLSEVVDRKFYCVIGKLQNFNCPCETISFLPLGST